MFKSATIIFAVVVCTLAKPGVIAPVAYSAPLVAAPVVTATSSQVIARNYNGLAAAPLVASPAFAAYTAPGAVAYSAYSAPFTYAAAPAAFAAPVTYSAPAIAPAIAPLKYTAAPVLL